jgi:fructose-1,6-bisphosphatase/sedoheptulose 1,7-bisphosphatase-like protein
VLAQAAAPEKEKVSITLDKPLVDEIRAQFGGRALSTSINDLLYAALAQERLGQLVDEMEQEAGPPSAEAYERVLAQWFAEN